MFNESLMSQISVLVVDDSADEFDNTLYLTSTFDSLGIDYFIHDVALSGTPDISILTGFDVVLWHTSTWGLDLLLWENKDEDSQLLKEYLDQPNAKLWLIGNDFMFDRYKSVPTNFESGSFCYDYLGMKSYVAQSYGDDGNAGVPFVTPASDNPISNLKNISWQFATLWWADQFQIRDEAKPVYLFGGDNYPLKDGITGYYFPRANGSKVLTFGFDLSLASNFTSMNQTVRSVMEWWQTIIASSNHYDFKQTNWHISPTLVRNELNIFNQENNQQPTNFALMNIDGKIIHTETLHANTDAYWQINLSDKNIQAGLYFCKLQQGISITTKKVIKI
jgi:hypothetical protein